MAEKNVKKNGTSTTKSLVKEVLGTSVYILIVLLLSYMIVKYVGQRTEVVGESMELTLIDGDNLIVDKLSYRFRDPQRFEIVVFPYRYDPHDIYIKRIIGLPGETVQINDNGDILIDGEVLKEYYGREVIEDAHRASEPIVLGDDEYFVLGDNRNNSRDSRWEDVGNIKRDELLGKVLVRIYPFREFGKVD
ncbi:MAG: signal peptidase I [Lachnospiraceae bacterium]|jgi:signal peptidase I|nr:signal peptidase I [Lachnospiraceae bacterium]